MAFFSLLEGRFEPLKQRRLSLNPGILRHKYLNMCNGSVSEGVYYNNQDEASSRPSSALYLHATLLD